MSEILSQSEIEALLNTLQSDPDAAAATATEDGVQTFAPKSQGSALGLGAFQGTSKGTGKAAIAYEVYDFRRPDKFSKDQLRTLQMLHETFARLAASSLSAYLRTSVTLDVISLEQVPYEEYLRSINQSVFTIMSLPPLTGQAVLEIEFGLVFSIIDRMLGGPGKGITRSVLTDIERPLVRQTIERTFGALKSAWEGVVIVNPGIDGMETSAQFVQIAPPNDIVVTILFEVKVGNQRGAMSLCVPYLVLKPITTKLSAQKWFVSSSRKQSPVSRMQLAAQVHASTVNCTVLLGQSTVSVQEFIHLKTGDIVRLDQRADRDMKFKIGPVPKFSGKPALQGKKLVFTVSNVIEE